MKIQISISANIVNNDEIKEYLESMQDFAKTPQAAKWLTSNVRNYIIKQDTQKDKLTGLALDPYTKAKRTDPVWLKEGLKEGKEFHTALLTPAFKQNIEHALGYINTVPDPVRISIPDAITLGNKLISEENAKAGSGEDPTKLKVLHTFNNGFKWVQLETKKQLEREGKLMNHCVGSNGQRYINDTLAKKIQIWSLRDKKNIPYCTIEYNVKSKKVFQIKGPSDLGVQSKVIPYCHKFLTAMVKQKVISSFDTSDLQLIGVLEQDGVWYNMYELPENFKVNSSLNLIGTTVNHLPKGLKVSGDLDLPGNLLNLKEQQEQRNVMTELPEGLTVSGIIRFNGTPIKSLPAGLIAQGVNLDLTNITELPEGMFITNLILNRNTTKLPNTLKVQTIRFNEAPIDSIPPGVRIGKEASGANPKLTKALRELVPVINVRE